MYVYGTKGQLKLIFHIIFSKQIYVLPWHPDSELVMIFYHRGGEELANLQYSVKQFSVTIHNIYCTNQILCSPSYQWFGRFICDDNEMDWSS